MLMGALRREVKDLCEQVMSRLVRTGFVISSTIGVTPNTKRVFLEVDGDIVEKQIDEEEIGTLTRYFQHYGFRSRPSNRAEAVYLAVRGSRKHRIVIATDDAGGTKELEAGEVEIFTQGGGSIWLDKSGNIVLNGGTLLVARKTDPVKPTDTFNTVMQALIAVANGVVPGSVTPAQAAAIAIQIGEINGGAAKVKA